MAEPDPTALTAQLDAAVRQHLPRVYQPGRRRGGRRPCSWSPLAIRSVPNKAMMLYAIVLAVRAANTTP